MTAAGITKGNSGHSGYKREEHEWYIESIDATRALLRRFPGINGPAIDPSCGGGNVVMALREAGIHCDGADVIDRGFPGVAIQDFFQSSYTGYRSIVSNPPFNVATRYALKALNETTEWLCLFLPTVSLEGERRYKQLIKDARPNWILQFINRVSCPPGGTGIEAENGKKAYAWWVWNKHWPHRGTQIDWIWCGEPK
jgi:hypothetical protein